MRNLIADLRFAVRKFARAPGLSLAALVTLALGIGANTTIFSLADGVWLRPLQIADPAHLITLQSMKKSAAAESERDTGSSYAEFGDLRQSVQAVADVAAVSGRGVVIDRGDGLRLLLGRVVSDNYFDLMGAHAALGVLPGREQLLHSETPDLVLGYAAWKEIFGGDPSVVGSTVKIRGGVARIAAVLPEGFRGVDRMIDPQVYVSRSAWLLWHPDEARPERTLRDFDLYARLRPGVTLEQAKAQLHAVGAGLAATYPEANKGRELTAQSERESDNPQIKILSLLLLAIAGAVLLIACTNILNLLLALNDGRRREIAMRVALGASRSRLALQFLTEYGLLALVGTGLALVLAQRLIALVPALMPNIGYPLGFDFRLDGRVLAFTLAASLVSVLICGVIPMIRSSHASPLEALRKQFTAAGKLRMPARKIFVAVQLAVSVALLVATGLLVRTLMHIETMDLGFNRAQQAMLIEFAVGKDGPARKAEFDALTSRIRALPGVKDATLARVVPLSDNGGGATRIVLAPNEVPSPTAGMAVWFNWVDDAYFRVLGVPMVRGRAFTPQDFSSARRVAIVNRTLAKRLFGTEDAVGRHLRVGRENPVDAEIVGIAADGRYNDVTESPQPYLYLPLTADAWPEVVLFAPTTTNPGPLLPAAQKALRELDPNLLVMSAQTLTDHMQFHTYENRMAAWLSASLGGLALLLTAVGLYGVTAYSVSRRTREIGIRMALGARRETVFSGVLKDGLKLALAGLGVGMALALLLGRAMAGLLYGVTPFDPVALGSIAGLVLLVSVGALSVPARRALRVEPTEALREE